ncbi:AAA family ATPase [Streptosporangium lutulentum]
MVTELAERARADGFAVLVGQCAELGDALPYLPLADALRGATGELSAAIDARPVLGRLLPGGGDLGQESTSGLTQQQLFGSMLGFLSVQPVLLVLEDLHWADQSTRDLLVFLSRMLQTERVCLIGTYRTDDLHRRHPLRRVLAELKRLPSVTAVELSPLDRGEMTDYLVTLGGTDARMMGEVVDRAEGNPFYAEELLEAASDGSSITDDLAGLLLSRVELLSDAAQGCSEARRSPPPRRPRPAPAGLGAGEPGLRRRHARDRLARAAPPRRGVRLRLPARAPPGGRLHRPAARRADPGTRRVRPPADPAGGRGGRARPPLSGSATIWPEPWPRPSKPGGGPNGWAPPPRRIATSTGLSASGTGFPTRSGSPESTTFRWPPAAPSRRLTAVTTTGRSPSCDGSRPRPRSPSGWPISSATPTTRRGPSPPRTRPSRWRPKVPCSPVRSPPMPAPSTGASDTMRWNPSPPRLWRWRVPPAPPTRRPAH